MFMLPDYEAINALAHSLWERRGRPIGSPEEDWYEAERQLRGQGAALGASSKVVDESIKQSFPASDPPSSQLPDEPPSNSGAKWAAAGVDREELCRDADLESPPVTGTKEKGRGRRADSGRYR